MGATNLPHAVYDAAYIHRLAINDLQDGLFKSRLWYHFAVHDIKQRFRRSIFGPLWITLSMGIMVTALGFVFSQVFRQSIQDFIPYLATGLIFWGFLTSVVNEGCTSFIEGQGYIKNVPMPVSVHYYRVFARNVITWLFNMAIFVLVFVIFQREVSWIMLLFIPGFVMFTATIFLIGFFAAILSTRYRDIPVVIGNLLQVVFFVTPVFWSLDTLPDRPAVVTFNPVYHMIELVRAPLLGELPSPESWAAVAGIILILGPTIIWLYRKTFFRIPYWV